MRTAIVVPSIFAGSAAFAQEPGEIIVTAQRREQAVIDVPISVSVLAGEKADDLNLSNFTQIAQQVPNFNITFNRGSNATPDLSIRGVRGEGSNGRLNESSVAAYVDEIYLGDETALSGQMFDVQRIEVLRGPQGTLFGRNTTGGLVHFVSASPTAEFTGKASLLYGSDNWLSLNAAVSGGLGEHIRTRLAGQLEQHDGHFINRATVPGALDKLAAKKVWSIRSTTDFDIGEASTLRLQITHSETDAESTPNLGLGIWKDATRAICSRSEIFAGQCVDSVILGGQPRQVRPRSGVAITELGRDDLAITQDLTSLTAKIETDLGWASLINIANYTQFKSLIGVDGDQSTTPSGLQGANIQVQLNNESKQFSEELRLQGTTDTLNWVAGIYYYQDRKKSQTFPTVRNNAGALVQIVRSRSRVDTKSGAVFGQADWKFADQWTLSAGARYTIEKRALKQAEATMITAAGALPPLDILPGVTDPDPVTKDVTGRVSLTFEPTADNSLYGSYSRGAKSVSYNTYYSNAGGAVQTPASRAAALAANAALTGPVGQEHLDAFEIGSKNRFFDRALMINLAAFYYLFDGKQELLSVADLSTGVPVLTTRFLNIGKAEMYGAELELTYTPNDRWDFSVSGGLLETEITKSPLRIGVPRLSALPAPNNTIPLQGLPIPQTPKWNVSATLAHHIPVSGAGVFTLQAEGRAQAKQNFTLSNDPIVDIPSYGLVNFRIMWESEDNKFNAQVFVTNAFNKFYIARMNDTIFSSGALVAQMGEPRLWGVKFGAEF